MHNFRPAMICRGYRVPGAWIAHGGYLGITCVLSSLFEIFQCDYLLLGHLEALISAVILQGWFQHMYFNLYLQQHTFLTIKIGLERNI